MSRPWLTTPERKRLHYGESDPFYGKKKWKGIRRRHFSNDPWCTISRRAGYYQEAIDLDHIIPRPAGDDYNPSNRQGLSKYQHTRKTNLEIKKGPLFEHKDGLPEREFGKLVPIGKKPIVLIIGASGSGKTTIINHMDLSNFDKCTHIDNSNWSNVAFNIHKPGYHLLECVGSHSALRRLLLNHELSFYVIRIISEDAQERSGLSKELWTDSNETQKTLPADLEIVNTDPWAQALWLNNNLWYAW